MIKVLILEDKPPILANIKSKVLNFDPNIQIIGTAFNGVEALELLDYDTPDIIITDICMPIMDGLEFISRVTHLGLSSKFIIISGYGEFEYARTALKLGVDEYLLKPLLQDELNNALKRLIVRIEDVRAINNNDVLQNLFSNPSTVNAFESRFSNYKKYYTILICGGSFTYDNSDYSHPNNFFISEEDICNLVMPLINNDIKFMAFPSPKFNELIGVFLLPEHQTLALKDLLAILINKLDHLNLPITIAFTTLLRNGKDLSNSIHYLQRLVRKQLVFSLSSLIYENMPLSNTQYNTKKIKVDYDIILAFRTNKLNQLRGLLADFMKSCRDNLYTQEKLENQLKSIVRQIVINNDQLNTDDYLTMIEEMLAYNNNYRDLNISLISFLQQLHESCHKVKIKPIESIVEQTAAYIKNNYAKQLTIHHIAIMFNVDSCYLSKCFKNNYNKSPMNYLTEVRISQAKYLLVQHKDIRLKEIAEIVGYSNQYYFSRIFKSSTGMTPTQFRDSNN